MAAECTERERLVANVITAMEKIIDIILEQRRELKNSGQSACVLDGHFGEAVGEKERALGALCEHEKEHGCV